MKKLTRKDLLKVNGGDIRPPKDGKCLLGWYLCPSNICVYDKGGEEPINTEHPHYNACFG